MEEDELKKLSKFWRIHYSLLREKEERRKLQKLAKKITKVPDNIKIPVEYLEANNES